MQYRLLARETKLVSWFCMGRGLIANDSFVSWSMRSVVSNLPFAVGGIPCLGLEGRDGILFFHFPEVKKGLEHKL